MLAVYQYQGFKYISDADFILSISLSQNTVIAVFIIGHQAVSALLVLMSNDIYLLLESWQTILDRIKLLQ